MPFAVTHVLVAIVILDILRHYVFGLKKFPRYLLVIGGIAGLAPDIDIPLGWAVSLFTGSTVYLHGLFTHSIFFALLFFGIGVILRYRQDRKWAAVFFVIAAGWSVHILLDCTFGDVGSKLFVWPFTFIGMCPALGLGEYYPSIDAVILVVWFVHEELHKRIKDYL